MVDVMREQRQGVCDELYSIGRQLGRRTHYVGKTEGYSVVALNMYDVALDRVRLAAVAADQGDWHRMVLCLRWLKESPAWDVCLTRVDRAALDSIIVWGAERCI